MLSSAKFTEILGSFGYDIVIELKDYAASLVFRAIFLDDDIELGKSSNQFCCVKIANGHGKRQYMRNANSRRFETHENVRHDDGKEGE